MSFLTIKGKRFVCEACSKIITVDYEEPEITLLVGEIEMRHQHRLDERYRLPEDDPEDDASYIYEMGLCQHCWEEKMLAMDNLKERMQREEEIFDLIDSLTEQTRDCSRDIRRVVQKEAVDIVRKMGDEDYIDFFQQQLTILLEDHTRTADKKMRAVRKLIKRYRKALSSLLVKEAIETEAVRDSVAVCREQNKPKIETLQKLLNEPLVYYESQQTNDPEILEGYFPSDCTIEVPKEESEEEYFYIEAILKKNETLRPFFFHAVDLRSISIGLSDINPILEAHIQTMLEAVDNEAYA